MADIAYTVTQSGFLLDNQHLSRNLDGLTGEKWFFYVNDKNARVSDGLAYRLTSHLPVSTAPRHIKSTFARGFVDDFYYRIHIDKTQADLGVVASRQVINFALWNAYFEPLDLKRIDGLTAGVYFEPSDLPPLVFYALEERVWTLHILSEGDARLDLAIHWRFTGKITGKPYGTNTKLHGQRIIGFAWLIDWDKGVNESLAWHTDILQSQTGAEQRRSLRLAPRLTLEAEVLLYDKERTLFDLAMSAWASRAFVVPIWFYQTYAKTGTPAQSYQIVCDTSQIPYHHYPYVMLIKNAFEYEVGEIERVDSTGIRLKRPLQSTWQIGTQIFPAVSAHLTTLPSLSKKSAHTMRTAVSFLADSSPMFEAGVADSYQGYPVLNLAPSETDNLTHSYQRLTQMMDNLSGRPLVIDNANASFSLYQYRWLLNGIDEHHAFYGWLGRLNGRQKALWLPSFSEDLKLAKTIASGLSFEVFYCGYAKFGQGQNGRQYVRITLTNGEQLYRKIVSAQELGNTERLMVDEPFLQNIGVPEVKSIQFMSLCRLNSDTVSLDHKTDVAGVGAVTMSFVGIKEN